VLLEHVMKEKMTNLSGDVMKKLNLESQEIIIYVQ
jgi:hypothetical protein